MIGHLIFSSGVSGFALVLIVVFSICLIPIVIKMAVSDFHTHMVPITLCVKYMVLNVMITWLSKASAPLLVVQLVLSVIVLLKPDNCSIFGNADFLIFMHCVAFISFVNLHYNLILLWGGTVMVVFAVMLFLYPKVFKCEWAPLAVMPALVWYAPANVCLSIFDLYFILWAFIEHF